MATNKVKSNETVFITEPNFEVGQFKIRGTAPYVQHKFSKKAKETMLDTQKKKAGAKGKNKEPRKVEKEYKEASHIGEDGRYGIPCPAFRSAMIDACRAAGAVMTLAKMSVFCLPDTIDKEDGTPLVHISGEPEPHVGPVRLARGVTSIAVRPMWKRWTANVKLQWDGDQFSIIDVVNLLMRAGIQVGIGEGRPFSKASHGCGWGTFELIDDGGK